MLSNAVIGVLLVVGQLSRPIIPELPSPPDGVDETTWIVTMQDGSEARGFVQDAKNDIQLNFYADTPWAQWPFQNNSLIRSRVKLDEEGFAQRKARHDKEFPANNYTLVGNHWIPNEIVEPAQRAHELHNAAEKRRAERYQVDAPEASSAVANVSQPASQSSTSPAQRWGAHVLIGLGALIAAAVLARFTLFRDR